LNADESRKVHSEVAFLIVHGDQVSKASHFTSCLDGIVSWEEANELVATTATNNASVDSNQATVRTIRLELS